MPTMDTTPTQALAAVREYFVRLDLDRAQYRDWIGGTIFGGPNGNGEYPLTDFTNNTSFIKCPARIISDVGSGGGGGGSVIVPATNVMYNTQSLATVLDTRFTELTATSAQVVTQTAQITAVGAQATALATTTATLNGLLTVLRTDHDGLAGTVTAINAFVNSNDTATRALITAESSARTTADSAFAATVLLIGASSNGGTAFLLNLDSVKVTPTITLGQRFTTIFATTDSLTAAAQTETNARIAGDTAEATARTSLGAALRTETDTKVAAAVATEATARVAGDTAEASQRTTLAAALRGETSSAILTEQNTRATAIAAEATARTSLATTLRGETAALVTSEETARVAGDAAEATARTNLAATLRGETTAAVSSEASARTSGYDALSNRLTTVEASTGSDVAALQSFVNSRVATEETARINADLAIGTRIDTVEASRQTAGQVQTIVNARVATEETARIAGDAAEALQRTELSARVSALVTDPEYYGSNQGFDDFSNAMAVAGLPASWSPWTGSTAGFERVSDGNGGWALRIAAPAADAKGISQIQTGLQPGDCVLALDFRLVSGSLNGATIALRLFDNANAISNVIDFRFSDLKVNDIAIGENPGAGTYRTRTLFKISAPASGMPLDYGYVYALINGYTSNIGKTVDLLFAGTRPATDGEIAGQKALAQNTTLAASITTEQNARIAGDAAEATARTALAASVPGQISAAVTTEATARANADGALSTRIDTVTSTAGSTAASLSVQATAIADLFDKTEARFEVIAVAGTGRARLRVVADANGGGGVDIEGDLRVSGDLLVGGTVRHAALDVGSLVKKAEGNIVQTFDPLAGQTLQVLSFPLGIISPGGSILFEYNIVAFTNAGLVNSSIGGFPSSTRYSSDGGVFISAVDDVGGVVAQINLDGSEFDNTSGSFVNFKQFQRGNGLQILDNPRTVATNITIIVSVAQGSFNSGQTFDGERYSQTVSADYYLTSAWAKAKWTFI